MKKITFVIILIVIVLISIYTYTGFVKENKITANTIKQTITNQQNNNQNTNLIYESNSNPEIYFTKTTNITPILLNLISSSTDIKCALYDVDYKPIVDALKQKKAKVAVEDKNYANEFHTANSSGEMHNKFCVFDNKTIITGATNLNDEGIYKNDNNFLVIHSIYLAKNYLAEFDEIYNDIFAKGEKVIYPQILLNNKTLIKNYFCPEDECQKHVIEELNKANQSIYFMTFSFTDKTIADKLIEKNNKGIIVQGVFEKQRWNNNYEVFKYLNASNVTMIPDKNKYIMHHKVFIIDNKTVITGSYNPTGSGNKYNDENIVIITDEKITYEFINEFERLKK